MTTLLPLAFWRLSRRSRSEVEAPSIEADDGEGAEHVGDICRALPQAACPRDASRPPDTVTRREELEGGRPPSEGTPRMGTSKLRTRERLAEQQSTSLRRRCVEAVRREPRGSAGQPAYMAFGAEKAMSRFGNAGSAVPGEDVGGDEAPANTHANTHGPVPKT